MNTKPVLLMSVICAFLALLMNVIPVSFAAGVQKYPLADVYAWVSIVSPVENASYSESLTVLNVSVMLSVYAYTSNPGIIPYQDISCIYSLDGGEWKSIPFQFYSGKGVMPSSNPGRYYDQITCFYNATMEKLSEGKHSIRVEVKPDSLRSYKEWSTLNQSVNFAISNSLPTPSESNAPASGTENPQSSIVAAGTVTAIGVIASLGIILYFKKHKALEKKE